MRLPILNWSGVFLRKKFPNIPPLQIVDIQLQFCRTQSIHQLVTQNVESPESVNEGSKLLQRQDGTPFYQLLEFTVSQVPQV
jgi:hypothetical protein